MTGHLAGMVAAVACSLRVWWLQLQEARKFQNLFQKLVVASPGRTLLREDGRSNKQLLKHILWPAVDRSRRCARRGSRGAPNAPTSRQQRKLVRCVEPAHGSAFMHCSWVIAKLVASMDWFGCRSSSTRQTGRGTQQPFQVCTQMPCNNPPSLCQPPCALSTSLLVAEGDG